jgi:hypothetical protein
MLNREVAIDAVDKAHREGLTHRDLGMNWASSLKK